MMVPSMSNRKPWRVARVGGAEYPMVSMQEPEKVDENADEIAVDVDSKYRAFICQSGHKGSAVVAELRN